MQKPERIGFIDLIPVVPRCDVILVNRTLVDAGNETFPNARILTRVQRMGIFVPAVEVADDRDGAGIRGPDTEVSTGVPVDRSEMGAHLFIRPVVAALIEEIKI